MSKTTEAVHLYFMNNSISSLIRGVADWMRRDWLAGRSDEIVISTMSKAVQYYTEKIRDGHKMLSNRKLPFITIDPAMDFEPADPEGRLFTGYQRFTTGLAAKLFSPSVYSDDSISIEPVLNFYRGTFEITIWCSSIYELIDTRVFLYQLFGNTNREIKPVDVLCYMILPDKLTTYSVNNPFSGTTHTLDWTAYSNVVSGIVPNINRQSVVWPFTLSPRLKLQSISDGSDKYGGSGDSVSDYRLSVSIDWESEILTHLAIINKIAPTPTRVSLDIAITSMYSKNSFGGIDVFPKEMASITYKSDMTKTSTDMIYDRKSAYLFTLSDVTDITAGNSIIIDISSDPITDPNYVRLYTKSNTMFYEYDWVLVSSTSIKLIVSHLSEWQKDIYQNDALLIVRYVPN